MKKALLVAIIMVFGVSLVACGSAPKKKSFGDAPSWFDNPVKGCGVGTAKMRSMRDLARTSAVASARADLSKQLESTVATMVKKYQAEGEADAKDFSEELTTGVIREVSQNTLVGTRVAKTEVKDNEFYAMVCLDPETFADAFSRMDKLSEKARVALKKRAEEEFKDMDAQIEKLKDR